MTSESAHRAIGVAVLGLGNVGSEVVRIIREQAEELEARVGAPLELRGVAVRRIGSDRGIPEELQTTDAESLVGRDDVDIVVEVIGGIELPRKLILSSLNSGKSVVTANKALLADHTGELAEAAEANSVDLYFEAAVAGAIPVIRPLTQSLAGDRVNKVAGIVNGTTNFILSAMDETGADYEETLAEAGRLGYAEADPTADAKLRRRSEGSDPRVDRIPHPRHCRGRVPRRNLHDHLRRPGVGEGTRLHDQVALDLRAHRHAQGQGADFRSRVPGAGSAQPSAGLGQRRVQRRCRGSRERRPAHVLRPGRRRRPHASAVMGDLVMAARNKVHGGRGPRESKYAKLKVAPMGDILTRYYVNMEVADKEGVLSAVAAEFAKHGVSISVVRQEGAGAGARLVVVTHVATDAALSETVAALNELEFVTAVTSVLRLEGTEQ